MLRTQINLSCSLYLRAEVILSEERTDKKDTKNFVAQALRLKPKGTLSFYLKSLNRQASFKYDLTNKEQN